jgi:hypothetical protein
VSTDVIAHGLLGEILATVKRLEQKVDAMKSTASSGDTASDRDLDGQWGNPIIRKDPKRWDASQGSYVGCKYSECPPEYLEAVAALKDWQAGMDDKKGGEEDKRKAKFARLDAARARGWAQRLRNGWKAPEQKISDTFGDGVTFKQGEDDIPF